MHRALTQPRPEQASRVSQSPRIFSGIVDQALRDRHVLLLAAGELIGVMIGAACEPYHGQRFQSTRARVRKLNCSRRRWTSR